MLEKLSQGHWLIKSRQAPQACLCAPISYVWKGKIEKESMDITKVLFYFTNKIKDKVKAI